MPFCSENSEPLGWHVVLKGDNHKEIILKMFQLHSKIQN